MVERFAGVCYNGSMSKQTIVLITSIFVVVMNIISFSLMGRDKRCARQGKWRISEKTLFLVTACFGGLGGVLGMKMFHHKTQHWYEDYYSKQEMEMLDAIQRKLRNQ